MNDISLLNSDKEKYNEMKDALNRVIQYLNDAIDNLESASSVVSLNNIINEVRADVDKVNLYKINLINQVNWLKNTILPAIDNNISECNSQIDNLMAAMVAATSVVAPVVQTNVNQPVVRTKSVTKTQSNVGISSKLPVKINTSNSDLNSKKITTSTSVNNMATRNKVSTTTVNKVKNAVSKLGSLIGRFFR